MRRIANIFLLLLIFSNIAKSANDEPKYYQTDTVKIKEYIKVAGNYGWNMPDSMIANATRALTISEELNYQEGLFLSYQTLSSARYVTGDFGKGLNEAKSAIDIARKNKREDWEVKAINTLGLLYMQTEKYNEAIECFESRISYYTKNKNDTILGSAYNNLANCYYLLNNYPKSITIRQKAISIRKRLHNETTLGDSYNDLGETYMKTGMSDSAIYYLKQCLEIKEKAQDDEMTAVTSLNLGIEYTNRNELASAKQYLNESYQLALKMKSKSYQMNATEALAKLAHKENNSKEEAALLNRFVELKDTVYNEENQKQVNLLHTELETEKKEMRIRSLQAEEKQQQTIADAEKKKNTLILVFSISGIILLAVFLVIVTNRFRVTKKQNAVIEQQRAALHEKNKDITDSINYAKRLQDAILPPISEIKQNLPESFVLYKPKDIVAGDFYWMQKVRPNGEDLGGADIILIAACDSTGHGVPGALVSVVCSNALNRTVKEFKITEPGKILDKVRELVLETFEKSESEVKDGMDVSLAAISYQPSVNSIDVGWSGAHNPLWYMQNSEFKELAPNKQPIGAFDKPVPFNTIRLNLSKGDCLYLFTDGYADQFGGPKGKKFKYKQMQELLVSNASKPMAEQSELLNKTIEAWRGDLEQVDDILVIGIRV